MKGSLRLVVKKEYTLILDEEELTILLAALARVDMIEVSNYLIKNNLEHVLNNKFNIHQLLYSEISKLIKEEV